MAADTLLAHRRQFPRTVGDLHPAVLSPMIGRRVTGAAGLGGMQDEGIAFEGLRRAVAALEDLETVDALRDALS